MSEKIRVLIVEDLPSDAELIVRELKRSGLNFDYRLVDAPDAFVAALTEFQPDVILSDFSLPLFSGLDALKLTQSLSPTIPLIIVTGSLSEETAVEVMKAGAADYILKDRLKRLAASVDIALSRMRALEEKRRAEEALRESEQRLKEAQRLGKIGHWEFDLETRRLSWSDMVFTIYERDPKLGPPSEDEEAGYYAPEDAKRLRDLANTAIKTGKPYETDVSLRLPSGRVTEVVAIGTPVKNSEGRVIRLLGTVQDFTERKLIEVALRTSEERHRTLFETMQQGVVYQDADGWITHANPAAERILGLTLGQMRGRTSMDPGWRSIHEDGSDFPGQEHPAMVALRTGKPVTDVIMGVFNPADEGYHWIVVSAIPQFRANEAQPYQVFTTFTDITERKRAEEALKKSAQTLRDTGEMAKVGGWELDLATKDVFMTEEVSRIHGMEPGYKPKLEEAETFYAPESIPALEVALKKAMETGEPYDLESLFIPSGSKDKIWVRSLGKAVYSGGKIVKLAGTFQNIDKYKRAEEALRESEERYRILVENAFDAIYLLRGKHYEYVNPRFCEITGYSREELISPDFDYQVTLTDESKKIVRERYEARQRGEMLPDQYMFQIIRKSGEVLDVEVNTVSIGKPGDAAVIGIMRDITERKQAEEALRESETRYRAILEGAGEGILVADLEAKKFRYANPAICRMLRYSADELLEMGVFDIHPKYALNDVIAEFEAQAQGKKTLAAGLPCLRKDGTVIYVDTVASKVILDGVPCNVGFFNDITERKQAEVALRGSEARLRRLIEGSNDIIYVLQDNHFVMVNSKFEELTGYSSEEASAPDFDFTKTYTPESKELIAERMRKCERGEAIPDRYAFRILTKAGKELDLETSVSQIEWEGKPATLGICRDMTEHHSLENQLHQAMKMEAVGRLAGGVAHDFNNLLTVIHGHAELAMMTVDPRDPLHNNVDEILKAAQRAAVLVRQLLAFSRKQPMEPKIIRLNDVLTELNKMLRRIIGEDIDLKLALGDELWPVKVDPAQMEQVIINLSVNARDAMPAGGMLMLETQNVQFDAEYVRTHTEASVGPYVMLAVSDNGTGMGEEVKKRIFEPFFTTKGEGKGTGLGLATVYGIVKQSGGFINVYSELGVGTIFKVYLPRVTGEAEDIKKKVKPAEIPRGTETILFVEDEEAVRALSVMFLKRHGYTILEAPSGGEAYLKCKHLDKPVDLIITDVIMPGGMNGAELIQTIRSELWHNVKALYISGYTANAVFHNGVLDPGTPYLQKPFRLEDLGHKVREVLDGK